MAKNKSESAQNKSEHPIVDDPNPSTVEEETEYIIVDSEKDIPKDDDEEIKDASKVTLSPEDFKELKDKGEYAPMLARGLADLGDAINKQSERVPAAKQSSSESNEDFEKRLNDDFFKDSGPSRLLDEFFQRKMAPYLQQVAGATAKQARDLLEIHPEKGKMFSKYKGDIEGLVKGLPPDQQSNPAVWQYAYDEVLKDKGPEIMNERVDRMVEEKLKELGVGTDTVGTVPVGTEGVGVVKKERIMHSEGMSNVGGSGPRKKTVFLTTAQENDRMRRGMNKADYVEYVVSKG